MPQPNIKSQGTQPPPTGPYGHTLPRRTSPANSVTLRHHRLAQDASFRANPGSVPPNANNANAAPGATTAARRNSSGESHVTGQSDPMKWFDRSNQNPTATFDNHTMEVDPPFFQRETDSSNEDKPYPAQVLHVPPKLETAHSSSAGDYRSVIDDLTVEIQKLKEELRRYKQKGPPMLKKEKLFEIKVHGLPKRKKRELEATLRDFAASLEGSPDASSSQQNKTSRHTERDRTYAESATRSKHASSSSGSNRRPVDSAYASMSTGANSSGTSLGRSSLQSSRARTDQKVENYLRDIPEGLYPRHVIMTEKEKKKLVVRRLEQLFTGKLSGRHVRVPPPQGAIPGAAPLAPVMAEVQSQDQRPMVHQPPSMAGQVEPAREARILPPEQQSSASRKKSHSRDNGSASNSGGDQTESGGAGNSSGGTNPSPTAPLPPEQRPTRPKDLDPDRVQIPSENMDYIRHLGLVPPELLTDSNKSSEQQVQTDADGWVYLNLLCNLAQLHIINVTPDFVRSAVTGVSTKFQLSADGRKIRWRGGSEGTKFSSDSSGEGSHPSPDEDNVHVPSKRGARKRQKTGHSTGDDFQSGSSSKDQSKFGQQFSASSESFHYKPLFVHQDSSGGNTSMDGTLSSFGPIDDSNIDDSRWGQSGSGGDSNRRKRRHDGAIIYYSGAPFCTDLSGDPGDISPTTYMLSSGRDQVQSQQSQQSEQQFARPPPPPRRTESGSLISYRPLSDTHPFSNRSSKMDLDGGDASHGPNIDSGDDLDEVELDNPWSTEQQFLEVLPLEPCGLGGVLPDDHFMVVVTTKRSKVDTVPNVSYLSKSKVDETTESIIGRLATMSTSSPCPFPASRGSSRCSSPAVEIEYVSGRIKRLAPVPLPPPAIFFPPFSTDSSASDDDDDLMSEDPDLDGDSSDEVMSRRANLHRSDDYPDGVDLSSGDEDGEDPEDEPDTHRMYEPNGARRQQMLTRRQSSAEAAAGTSVRGRSKSASADAMMRLGGSSAATAGGVGSEISSSDEVSS